MGFWTLAQFKELQARWYSTLRATGFLDAERCINGESQLIQPAINGYRNHTPLEREVKIAYFQALTRYVAIETFDSLADKIILTMHSEGSSISEISAELKKFGFKSHRQTVRFRIRRYEHRWGLREWKPQQMNARNE